MPRIWLFIPVLALSVLMARCAPGLVPPSKEPIVLGALYSLNGGQAGLDVPSYRGARVAVDDINRAGGVLGRPVQLVVGDAGSAPEIAADLWQAHPEISNVFFTPHAYLGEDNDNPKIVAFRRAYTQAYPDAIPDAFAALGYDAVRLLITAIRHAGSADPEAVRNALAGIREFDGVTGQLGYPADSRIPLKAVTLLGVEGGGYRLVQQLMPAKTPAP